MPSTREDPPSTSVTSEQESKQNSDSEDSVVNYSLHSRIIRYLPEEEEEIDLSEEEEELTEEWLVEQIDNMKTRLFRMEHELRRRHSLRLILQEARISSALVSESLLVGEAYCFISCCVSQEQLCYRLSLSTDQVDIELQVTKGAAFQLQLEVSGMAGVESRLRAEEGLTDYRRLLPMELTETPAMPEEVAALIDKETVEEADAERLLQFTSMERIVIARLVRRLSIAIAERKVVGRKFCCSDHPDFRS